MTATREDYRRPGRCRSMPSAWPLQIRAGQWLLEQLKGDAASLRVDHGPRQDPWTFLDVYCLASPTKASAAGRPEQEIDLCQPLSPMPLRIPAHASHGYHAGFYLVVFMSYREPWGGFLLARQREAYRNGWDRGRFMGIKCRPESCRQRERVTVAAAVFAKSSLAAARPSSGPTLHCFASS